MDVFDFDTVKSEKTTAMLLHHRLRDLAKLIRIVELCVGLIFLSWSFTRLPFVVRIAGEYFRQMMEVVVSPLFIFLLSNVIVLCLLAKSGQFTGRSATVNNAEADLYEEFIHTGGGSINFGPDSSIPAPAQEEIVYQDKQIICEVNKSMEPPKSREPETLTDSCKISDAKTYMRSQSENLHADNSDEHCGKLRRSESEKCRKVANPGEIPADTEYVVDELSNEDFQRTIEAFIAKQVKFHKEEKSAIVIPSHA